MNKINTKINYEKIFIDNFNKLTDKQRQAVENIDKHLIITAGPGSGKTQLLSMRVAYILKNIPSIYPSNILLLTFTNAAVQAMKERIIDIIGIDGYDVNVYTFHSFANKLISENISENYNLKNKVLISDVEKYKLLEYILDNTKNIDDLRPFNDSYHYIREIAKTISTIKKEGYTPQKLDELKEEELDFLSSKSSKKNNAKEKQTLIKKWNTFKIIYKEYEKLLNIGPFFKYKGRYDYDDLINIACDLLKNDYELKQDIWEQYQYIMVDEFQDTNGAQLNLLFELTNPEYTNLCIVGDDDQSIYRFQGANLTNYEKIKNFLKESNIKYIHLDKNFRSHKNIVDLSNKFISNIESKFRLKKDPCIAHKTEILYDIVAYQYNTEIEELYGILENIKEIQNKENQNEDYTIAILCRKNEQVKLVADFLKKQNIKFNVDGKENILNTKIIRQIINIFKTLVNISTSNIDDALLFEVLNYDIFEIPQIDLQNLLSQYNLEKEKIIKELRETEKEPQINISIINDDIVSSINNLYQYLINKFDIDKMLINCNNIEDLMLKISDKENIIKTISVLYFFSRNINVIPVNIAIVDLITVLDLNRFLLKNFDQNEILDEIQINALANFIDFCNEISYTEKEEIIFSIKDFLDYLEIMKKYNINIEARLNQNISNKINITTVHSAKGLEYDYVIIPFLYDKNWEKQSLKEKLKIPTKILSSINEENLNKEYMQFIDEKRLFYVGLTRAKKQIILTTNSEKETPSKFISELGIELTKKDIENLNTKIILNENKKDIFDLKINTNNLLKDLVSTFVLNPSSLIAYKYCPRNFLYKSLLQTPSAKNYSNIYGLAVHFALEQSFYNMMKYGKLYDWQTFKQKFDFYINTESIDIQTKKYCQNHKRVLELQKWYERYSKIAQKPFALELSIEMIIDKNKYFSGKMDKVEYDDLDDKKAFVVVDYKTGNPDKHIKNINKIIKNEIPPDIKHEDFDDHLIQLISYKMLFEYKYKKNKVNKGKMIYIDTQIDEDKLQNHDFDNNKKDISEKEITLKDEYIDMLKDYINEVYQNIKNLNFDKIALENYKIPDKCKRCLYKGICNRI